MALGRKTGGRQKGTPNKQNPLKGYLSAHSMKYFEPSEENNGLSQFEADLLAMKPEDRVQAEIKLLKYHTPEMKSTEVDLTIDEDENKTMDERLAELSAEDEE